MCKLIPYVTFEIPMLTSFYNRYVLEDDCLEAVNIHMLYLWDVVCLDTCINKCILTVDFRALCSRLEGASQSHATEMEKHCCPDNQNNGADEENARVCQRHSILMSSN